MAEKLMLKRNYNLRQSRERLCDITAYFSCLLPAFESGFQCSRNDGPPSITFAAYVGSSKMDARTIPNAAVTRPTIYKIYVLFMLLMAYLLNQLDRYMLSIVTKPMAQEIHYGDQSCLANMTQRHHAVHCSNKTTEQDCASVPNNTCEWNYNGQGLQYELLAGPLFIVIYTLAGIPLGLWADVYNRKKLLGVAVVFWSVMTILMGLVNEYWQMAVLRFGLGIGEAGCTPFATSLIADYFATNHRALAIGLYNWGIYIGYSLSYAVGNFVVDANILGQGWRWTYYISGIPGLLIGSLIFITVMEPERQVKRDTTDAADLQTLLGHRESEPTCCQKAKFVCKVFFKPSVMLLCLAGSVRNAAGYVWAYNTQVYYESIGESRADIGRYMSWIPLAAGCVGVALGGFISDRVVKRVGPHARLGVLIISQIVAAPFVAGALFLSPPWAYISLIPGYVIGEMWIGITLAVLVEVVPTPLRTLGVAVYLFIISNIGGNMPLVVSPLQRLFVQKGITRVDALRDALYILYPGLYVLGAFLFLVTLLVLRRDMNRVQLSEYEEIS
ncbi:hypothetical protein LSH36_829g00010 [Paralvinella palmiformis]|uniref:Major facilitator superfamily (MFS) profile domain-containing protein n=1 Tax=Paralvinella palmiformis TaxID=53620 RepID=A0AAD9MTT4_9ANNE|nr:hypothetical protein LSH36_829g00010 [Paralvinella palmiformis]